ncbi:MAG: A/G-specific adenine glycosylase [Candidatus Saccharibacteria bacterium]|nr:MAG: A/G-specific adenine glycosylase [Candidatus Saccharibacteria bacterium]
MNTNDFQELLWQQGRDLYRTMPWREDTRPYYILVSELMLQQTQVDRVIPKFEAFIKAFPSEQELAGASLADVLKLWSGLGYNRRAKYLHDAAKKIVNELGGEFPNTKEGLLALPGVGPGTAGAIAVYAYNLPVAFIETNVRTVYFHHFFKEGELVTDKELSKVVEATLDREHPREFYWAIMDYGTWLKKNGTGRIAQSHHYKKQSPLKGSVREVRGQIIKVLTEGDKTRTQLEDYFKSDSRLESALAGLLREGLVMENEGVLHLTK